MGSCGSGGKTGHLLSQWSQWFDARHVQSLGQSVLVQNSEPQAAPVFVYITYRSLWVLASAK